MRTGKATSLRAGTLERERAGDCPRGFGRALIVGAVCPVNPCALLLPSSIQCLRQSLGWRNRKRLQVIDDIQDKLGTRQALKPAAVLSFACPLFPLKTARSTSTHRCSAPPPGLAAQVEIMESLEKMSSQSGTTRNRTWRKTRTRVFTAWRGLQK